ncbi:MAG: RluA family pseudouridine synthase [Gemmatimonadota bacterium]|nr:RluA family pseudouridine synthase [Gemmatimonadota bacterium]
MSDSAARLEVGEGDRGRLDRFVADRLGLSRTRVARLAEEGRVRVDGRAVRKSEAVEPGQVIEVDVPPPEPVDIPAEDLPLHVVHEDAELLVVDKPAGMVVHPAPGHRTGTLVNALLFHVRDLSGVGGRLRPGIVHRLDRDTSGLLLVAKTDRAHLALSEQLRRREIKRLYLAASWGHLPEDRLTVEAPIGRDPRDRKRMAVVEGGRAARTLIRVRERWPSGELLDVRLSTGRTHQIRVHLLHLGHPVIGDSLYGAGWERGIAGPDRRWARELLARVPRQFLHARALSFAHPLSGEHLHFRIPPPPDLAAALAYARTARGG